MNERIKDLHNQAIIFSSKNGGLRISSHIPNDYIEKFAELIVQECLGIIDEEGSHEGGSIRSMEAIKEHFGVE